MNKLKIIVGGNIGLYPTGGATWDYVQYPLGLKLLGHDVYYIEDTRQYPVFQKEERAWDDASGCVNYLKSVMDNFGFADKWAYRDVASGKTFGMSDTKVKQLCSTADVFINISCSTFMRDEYLKIPVRMLVDSDPMFTQIQYAKELGKESESKNWNTKHMIENHNYLFSFGENINDPSCIIPRFDFKWIPTRQPVCLKLWENDINGNAFTSVMNWSQRIRISYNDILWGQKDIEFEKFKNIARLLPEIKFEVVVNRPIKEQSKFDMNELTQLGWKILEPEETVPDSSTYKNFIINSHAEFAIAKETYVKSNSGWFSCRSACYLAASKPVITQETGWSKYIPAGEGLFTFTNMDSAVIAIQKVESDYKNQSRAAKEIANAYFNSDVILKQMLDRIN